MIEIVFIVYIFVNMGVFIYLRSKLLLNIKRVIKDSKNILKLLPSTQFADKERRAIINDIIKKIKDW